MVFGFVECGVYDVVVFDSEWVGFGVLGCNGGFVFGGYSFDNVDLLCMFGCDEGCWLYWFIVDVVDLICVWIVCYGIDCDIVDEGVMFVNWFDDLLWFDGVCMLMKNEFGVEWVFVVIGVLCEWLKM